MEISQRIGKSKVSKQLVKKVGQNLMPKFRITEEMKPVYASMHNYFHGIESQIPISKGIALVGDYGVGKTTAFKVFHTYLKTYFRFTENLFVISSVEDLIAELNHSDWIEKKLTYNYNRDPRGGIAFNPKNVLINEFGYIYDIKNYGTNVNELVEAWLMKRYDIYQQYGKVVHITTNFGTRGMKDNFHEKLIDRFKEMFHFVPFHGKSLRK